MGGIRIISRLLSRQATVFLFDLVAILLKRILVKYVLKEQTSCLDHMCQLPGRGVTGAIACLVT